MPDSTVLRQLLLGQLPSAERERIEELCESDDELRQAFDLAESRLIDEYVLRQLPPSEKVSFRDHFLTNDDRRERLAMAQGIVALSARSRKRRWIVGAGALLSACLLLLFVYSIRRPDALTVALVPSSHRSIEHPVQIGLRNAPETIMFEFQDSSIPPVCVATVLRIGDQTPLLTTQLRASKASGVRLPIHKSSLSEGDYLIVLEAGVAFRADFRFSVAP